jgi:phage-related minor tail protein
MADPFYQAFVEIVPEAKNLRKKLIHEFDTAGPDAGRRAGEGISSGVLGAVGKLAVPLGAAFAAINIGGMLKNAIGRASDLTEAGTAIQAVFGNAAQSISRWAKQGATMFGENEINVLRAAQSFGIYGKAAGLAGDELFGFSTDLVRLGTDLASFFNTDTSTAIEAIGAGLRGESEPLRQFGVLLDDAALRARALGLGIYDGTGALTQQQRVLAAHQEILAQTSTTQGDFERTSGGLANQQRILAAGWQNITTTIGALFLPATVNVVSFLNTRLIPAVHGFASSLTTGGGEGFLAGLVQVVEFLKATFLPAFTALGPVLGMLGAQLLQLWQAFSPLSLVFHTLTPVLQHIIGTVTALAGVVGGSLTTCLQGVLAALTPVITTITQNFAQALQVLMPIIAQLATLLGEQLAAVFTSLTPVIMQVASLLGGVLGTVFATLLPVVTILATTFGQVFTAVEPLFTALASLLTPILSLISPLLQLMGGILTPLVELFSALLKPVLALVTPLIGLLTPAIQVVVDVLSFLINIITDALTWFVNIITGAENASEGMTGAFDNVGAFFAGMWDTIVGFFNSGIHNIVGFFTTLPAKILDALGNLGHTLFQAGRDLITGLLDGAGSLLRVASRGVV